MSLGACHIPRASRSGPASPADDGFTVLEALVSLALTAVVLGLLASGLHVVARGYERQMANVEQQDAIRRGIDVWRRDVRQMLPLPTEPAQGRSSSLAFLGTIAGLSFVTVQPPYPTRAGAEFVSYVVEQGAAGDRLIRRQMPYSSDRSSPESGGLGAPVVVLSGPFRMRLSYTTGLGGTSGWTSNWSLPEELPGLIRLEMRSIDDISDLWPPVIVHPLAAGGTRCGNKPTEACAAAAGAAKPRTAGTDGEGCSGEACAANPPPIGSDPASAGGSGG